MRLVKAYLKDKDKDKAQRDAAVADVTAKLVVLADAAVAKSDEVAQLTKQLYDSERHLTFALAAAGVVNARSFLEHVWKVWRSALPAKEKDAGKSRTAVFKAGLLKRPNLMKCLRQEVPTWAHASMDENQAAESFAINLEAIIRDANNEIHTFRPNSGLTLYEDQLNQPTVAALACIAKSTTVLCNIKPANTYEEDSDDTSV